MKNNPTHRSIRPALAFPLLAGVMTLAACEIDIDIDDGPLVERTYGTAPFDSIRIDAPFEVTVRQGTEQSVVVQVGKERLADVDVDVVDGELIIDIDGRWFSNGELIASITTTDVARLRVGSASDVLLAGVEIDELSVEVAEASRLRSSGTIDELSLALSEAAQADFDGTSIGHVDLTMSGASSAVFGGGTNEIEGSIRDASSLDVDELTTLRVDTTGASSIDRD